MDSKTSYYKSGSRSIWPTKLNNFISYKRNFPRFMPCKKGFTGNLEFHKIQTIFRAKTEKKKLKQNHSQNRRMDFITDKWQWLTNVVSNWWKLAKNQFLANLQKEDCNKSVGVVNTWLFPGKFPSSHFVLILYLWGFFLFPTAHSTVCSLFPPG